MTCKSKNVYVGDRLRIKVHSVHYHYLDGDTFTVFACRGRVEK